MRRLGRRLRTGVISIPQMRAFNERIGETRPGVLLGDFKGFPLRCESSDYARPSVLGRFGEITFSPELFLSISGKYWWKHPFTIALTKPLFGGSSP